MVRRKWIGLAAAALLGVTPSAWSQQLGAPTFGTPKAAHITLVTQDAAKKSENTPSTSTPTSDVMGAPGGSGGCPERCDGWGPTLPENVGTFSFTPRCDGRNPLLVYGWADLGYTYSSNGGGLLAVQPRENRFGNEFLVSQLALVTERKTKSGEFDWGFKSTFFAGADAALLAPLGGFTNTNPRFGADFRELYASAHLPVITEGGMDVRVGRMSTVIGYESALAPYRPFYSNDYQWFYAQDGAFTGALANLHVNKQLDVIGAITMGANTFFTMRGNGPCYLGQINYWTTEEKTTLLSASTYIGNQALFTAGPQFIGDADYMMELRIQHAWNKCLTQVLQMDNVWASGVGGIGVTEFYSFYSMWIYHATKTVDLNLRAEWVRDVHGSRTGVATHYGEITLGTDYHPTKYLRIRPEIRGDFSERPAFGPAGNRPAQLTFAIDALLSF